MADLEARIVDYAPWHVMNGDADGERVANATRLAALRLRGYHLADSSYVASDAVVDADVFTLGERSYLAAHTHVRDDVVIGDDCSLNVAVEVRGRVRIGNGVRIGARSAILGFNHTFADLDRPVHQQPHSVVGIEIEDDVWLGAHVLVLDGVTIGAHSVVGAGAVVTRDVPPYSVAVGNPARVVRDRRTGAAPSAPSASAPAPARERDRLRAIDLGERARRDVPAVLAAALDGGAFRDAAGCAPTVRAHCDAVELADLVGAVAPGWDRAGHADHLRSWQLADGRVPELGSRGPGGMPDGAAWPLDESAYHVLCVGYALDLLGSGFAHPVTPWLRVDAAAVPGALAALDWDGNAWGAGAAVDTVGVALTWAAEAGWSAPGQREAVVGWLATHRDPTSGLWGRGSEPDGWRLAVNGTYRLVRGTLAQWGVDLGGGEALVDTVLRHARSGVLGPARVTACDALDVVHLLWWARRTGAAGYREQEVRRTASAILGVAHASWLDGEGAPFAPGGTDMVLTSRADPAVPSLQGTEMWLALAWYAADLLGVADALGYTPRGIHRPTPRPAGRQHGARR